MLNMSNYFNDTPIETSEDDQYGINPFAVSLAKSIRSIKTPIGTTIALNGPWGSGKSSAVNLIRRELEKTEDDSLVVSDFKCWWYRGEEALILAFLQNLHSILSDKLKDKIKGLIPQLGRKLLQAGPVIGSAMALTPVGPFAGLAGKSVDYAKRLFPEGDTIENTFQKLAKILEEENRRFLIIIDDIDRLTPDEALAIFRMIKSVGRLPNVMYLLVFDRELAEKAVKEKYPSEGPHFLEKIIQAGFELPSPLRTDLNNSILSSIQGICGEPDQKQIRRIMNLFHDVVAPYLTTPRHITRFQNAISVTWPAIANEIHVSDFVALETLRLYEPSLFAAIRANKNRVCGLSGYDDPDNPRDSTRFEPFLRKVSETKHEIAKLALQRLFPRLEETGYDDGFISEWDMNRRVCIDKHFDTYFRLSLSNETLSTQRINELVAKSDDQEFIKSVFIDAANSIRNTGTSMVPVLLDELNSHAPEIDKNNVLPLLTTLFEIHDEIDLEIDHEKGFMSMGDTTLRYHWLMRRLTKNRFTLEERTKLYMSALETASLGWLVDFAASIKAHYSDDKDGSMRPDDFLVHEAVVNEVVAQALEVIRDSSRDGSLLKHDDLIYILYRWRDFLDNNASEVRAWTDTLLDNDEALVVFAKELTGESWSHSMGFAGLGDRVAVRETRAKIDDDIDIIDPDKLRNGLEKLQSSGSLENDEKEIVETFLEAWERRRSKMDRY